MVPAPLQTLVMKAPDFGRPRSRALPITLGVVLLVSLAVPQGDHSAWIALEIALSSIAAAATCSLLHRLEYRTHDRYIAYRTSARLMVQAVVFIASLGLGIAGMHLIGLPIQTRGYGAAFLASIFCGALWTMSASMGTILVILLERVVGSIMVELKARINLAMLVLVALTAVLSYWAAQLGYAMVDDSSGGMLSNWTLTFGFGKAIAMSPETYQALSESTNLLALSYLCFMVLLVAPAVMSASAKISNSLMANLEPLRLGFEAVSRGELDFRIPERGTTDFAKLNRTFNQMVQSLNLAKRMENAFGAYVSEAILDQIRNQHGEANLEPTLRMATVFFADIRGFTSLSERINPKQLLAVLNRFYEEVASVVEAHSGFLVQYIGDAVVVVFNGPMDQPNHADMAAACAVDIQRAVEKLNSEKLFPEAGDLHIGIGIATGPMVAGNLGDSGHLLQYTVLGDTVNQASRITGLTPPGAVYVNQRNSEMIDPRHDPQPLDAVKVKGRARKLVPYQIWPRAEFTDVTEVRLRPIPGYSSGDA